MSSIAFNQMVELCEKVLSETAEKLLEMNKSNKDVSSSVLLTPDTTPTKSECSSKAEHYPNSDSDIENIQEKTHSSKHCKELKQVSFKSNASRDQNEMLCSTPRKTLTRSNSDSVLDSPKPTKPKMGRSEKVKVENVPDTKSVGRPPKTGKSSKSKRATQKKTSCSEVSLGKTTERNRSKSVPPKKKPESGNHLVTEYFPVRRSNRVPTSQIKKQRQADIENLILSGSEDGLEIVEFPGKGRGVVSSKVFFKGDFVVEYCGDLIELTNAKQRENDYSKNTMIGCYMYYFNFQNKTYCIDATKETGKLGRLLNHSRLSNNCATKVVPISGKPYLIIVASRDIQIGEELLYDYGDRSKESLQAHPWLAL